MRTRTLLVCLAVTALVALTAGVALAATISGSEGDDRNLTQVVLGAAALASGFVSPRGFYLWGVALALHSPFTQGLTVHLMQREGIDPAVGTQGLVGFAVITAVLVAFAAFCYTVLSAAGMGPRLLIGGLSS